MLQAVRYDGHGGHVRVGLPAGGGRPSQRRGDRRRRQQNVQVNQEVKCLDHTVQQKTLLKYKWQF